MAIPSFTARAIALNAAHERLVEVETRSPNKELAVLEAMMKLNQHQRGRHCETIEIVVS